MLTILAALHYANASLPRRRIDLYAKIVEVMLEPWEASKRDTRPGDPLYGIVLEAREFAWLLATSRSECSVKVEFFAPGGG